MKKIILIVCIAAMSFASCSKYDDVALWNKSMDMDSRISDLEALCQQLNGEIQSLQAIVAAAQSGDCIISVVPVMQDGEEIGYTISFAQSDPVTIYHGKDGADGKSDGGYTPQIGVKQDTDGHYYWTLDGEWLAGDGGQKVLAEGKDGREGTDGNDGVTPQLKIEDGYWFVSYNNGESWDKLGKATGEDGRNGTNGVNGAAGKDGDSFFKDVDASNSDYVVFTLADGTEIKLPKYSQLAVTFDNDGVVEMKPNDTSEVSYTIVSALSEIEIEVVASSGINAKIVKTTGVTGTIHIATGSSIDDDSHILVFVSNGENTIMKKLVISERVDEDDDDDDWDLPDDMEIAFPDPVFRKYLLDTYDKNYDKKISKEEALNVTSISVSKQALDPDEEKIASFEGIQYFPNLVTLVFNYNRVTSLDISKNTALVTLQCHWNGLTALDLSNNHSLKYLNCSGLNYITTLDVSKTNMNGGSLECRVSSLKTLILKKGWEIYGITSPRLQSYVLSETEIIFVE